jgi:hypothetical protein
MRWDEMSQHLNQWTNGIVGNERLNLNEIAGSNVEYSPRSFFSDINLGMFEYFGQQGTGSSS